MKTLFRFIHKHTGQILYRAYGYMMSPNDASKRLYLLTPYSKKIVAVDPFVEMRRNLLLGPSFVYLEKCLAAVIMTPILLGAYILQKSSGTYLRAINALPQKSWEIRQAKAQDELLNFRMINSVTRGLSKANTQISQDQIDFWNRYKSLHTIQSDLKR